MKRKTSKRLKAAAIVVTPILLYLAIFGTAIKLLMIGAVIVYTYLLIFHTAATISLTAGGLLMGFLKKIPDSVTATILVIAAIYYFVRWMRTADADSPAPQPPSEPLRIEAQQPDCKNEPSVK